MKFTYRKLRGKIVEVFGTNYRFAEALNISENSLSKKQKEVIPIIRGKKW